MVFWSSSCAFVDWMFLRCWSRCPSVVASDLGKYCLMASTVTPGHVLKWPFLMAWIQVLVVGEKAHWCRYLMCSCKFFVGNVVFDCCFWCSFSTGVIFLGRCRGLCIVMSCSYNPVSGFLIPVITGFLFLLYIVHPSFEKVAVQPSSHNWPTEIKECLNVGRISVSEAWSETCGSYRLYFAQAVMLVPLGIPTWGALVT